MSGSVTAAAEITEKVLRDGEAVGIRIEKPDESVLFAPKGTVHLLLLSGEMNLSPLMARLS